MSGKGSKEDRNMPTVVRRKRDDRNSSGSSPDMPPTKSAKTGDGRQQKNDSNVWIVLNKIQRNTAELLEENHALRKQYEELKQSIEFNNSQLESLKRENKNLKAKVSSLKKSCCETKEDVEILYKDLAMAITVR